MKRRNGDLMVWLINLLLDGEKTRPELGQLMDIRPDNLNNLLRPLLTAGLVVMEGHRQRPGVGKQAIIFKWKGK